ncbi:hypothetical protein D3C74_262430 [compost metagenome]
MLRRQPVNNLNPLLNRINEDDCSVLVDRSTRNIPPRQLRKLTLYFSLTSLSKCFRWSHQDSRCHLVMLSLRQQVSSNISGISAIISQNCDFAWPGNAVDINSTIYFTFGKSHIYIAGTTYFINRCNAFRTISECSNGLSPAHSINFVHSGFSRCNEDVRINACFTARCRRSNHYNFRYARYLCRNDVHKHGGRISSLTPGHVYTYPLQGSDNLTQKTTIRLQIHPRISLLLQMESPNVLSRCRYRFYK